MKCKPKGLNLFARLNNFRSTLAEPSGLPIFDVAWLGKFLRLLEATSSIPHKPLTLGEKGDVHLLGKHFSTDAISPFRRRES
jgi:hypothetical protein